MTDAFYRAFEDRFRGSREFIRSRLLVYLPIVLPLLEAYPNDTSVVDLGCGRGEWLELLNQHGFSGSGIDSDESMLSACHNLGLNVQSGDALEFLSALPDESQLILTAFHLVEHISFNSLRLLVEESFRVLRPGGILIMETPNPENLLVGACSFYMDPTHHKPLPPPLLAFIPEYVGFERVVTMGLQEDPKILGNDNLDLYRVIGGASPDYAVVAQKGGHQVLSNKIGVELDRGYGVSFLELSEKYQNNLNSRISHLENDISDLKESPLWRVFLLLRYFNLRVRCLWNYLTSRRRRK